jgi:hydroxymethylpyrimidine pyrophosphatase-like HAD family hydrolase
MSGTRIRLLLSDVDGTLVRMDKTLTDRSIDAVHALHDAGIHFAVTSGRPPRGMTMLVEPLSLRTPLAAFNGGLVVEPDLDVVEERVVPDDLVGTTIALLESYELSVWVYQGADWLVRDPEGPHVAHESPRCSSPQVRRLQPERDRVTKIMVSDDQARRRPRPPRATGSASCLASRSSRTTST